MALNFDIARRYLLGKKSTNAINLITGISIFGITIGTAALILILSVFNGFESLLSSLFNSFNPDLKIEAVNSKTFSLDSELYTKLKDVNGVELISQTLEEVTLFEYQNVQEIGVIKGVDNNYKRVTGIDTLIIKGNYKIDNPDQVNYGIIGIGLRNKLSVNIGDKLNPITIYMPLRKNIIPGAKEFKYLDFYPSGVFSVQSESDYQYSLAPLDMVQELLSSKNISALELKIDDDETKRIQTEIEDILKDSDLKVLNRYEQDSGYLKIMNIEKWISFLIVGLTMLLIAFNLVGALWMIVLDKRRDIAILKSMGYRDAAIRKLFILLGILITCIGIIMGFLLAFVIYFIQKEFGIITISESFLIDSYPIKLKLLDFFTVALTVLIIGFLACLLPAEKASKMDTFLRSI